MEFSCVCNDVEVVAGFLQHYFMGNTDLERFIWCPCGRSMHEARESSSKAVAAQDGPKCPRGPFFMKEFIKPDFNYIIVSEQV